jgi:flagellar assembly protein FliH
MVFRQIVPASHGAAHAPAGKSDPQARASEPGPDYAGQIAQLQRQAEQCAHEAHAAGVKEGEAAGRRSAAAELQPVIERLSRAIEEIAGLRPRLRREAEADLVKLSLAIARRILRRELLVDPDALHGLVLAALEKLQAQEICRVKVHPSLAASVTACLRKAPAGALVEVAADASAPPGAVVFETGRGNLDASIETQFQEIERGLTDRLQGVS